jgi:hypothetical protein
MTATHNAIRVDQDIEGVQLALGVLFEESFVRSSFGDGFDDLDDETQRRLLAEIPPRTLSPGYFNYAVYLLSLASAIEAGVTYSADQLRHTDVQGLQAVSRARNEHHRRHPACSQCGTRQHSAFAPECRRCHAKFGGQG